VDTLAGVLALLLLSHSVFLLPVSFIGFCLAVLSLFGFHVTKVRLERFAVVSTRLDTLLGLALRPFAVVHLKPGLVEICQP
jgi:hypothetical protein